VTPVAGQDAETLAAVHAQAFATPWTAEQIAALIDRPEVFGLAAAGGFILLRAMAGEAEVLTLAVVRAERRRGLGRALLIAGLESARTAGAETAFLEVAADNDAAIALYEDAGFARVGRRRAYYSRAGGAMDALVLRRDLNSPAG
jgi:[ribosomal protein S18]-alanine N-acetyltransferase